MNSSNNFSALKCVLLDKHLSKVINSFLPPQQAYPDIQKKKDKVIKSLKHTCDNKEEEHSDWYDKCQICKANLRIWLINHIATHCKESYWMDEYFVGCIKNPGIYCKNCAFKNYHNLSLHFININYEQLRNRIERCHKAGIYKK